MQLRLESLTTHCTKPLSGLYVVSSDEHLLALEAIDTIRKAARTQGFTEREILTVDRSFKWGELLSAGQSMSLFGDKKIIELRIPQGKPGKEGAQALQQYVQTITNPAQDTVTIISLPKLDWATQKSNWVTALQESAIYIDIPLIERTQLPAWITQRLTQQQQSTDKEMITFIAERVEGNLLAAHQEILKLSLLYPTGKLSMEQIHDSIFNVARYDVFKLNEAMLAGDIPRLTRMINGLEGEGEALPLVLWAMSEEIRTLLKLHTAMNQGKPIKMLLKEYRIWGPRERLMEQALHRLSSKTLRIALQHAAQIDKMIKGLKTKVYAGDAWDALLQLGIRIAK